MNGLHREYALPFAAWELRLYLDTHPDDAKALALYRHLCAQEDCAGNYACIPVGECAGHWAWIDDPWPWEIEANRPDGRC